MIRSRYMNKLSVITVDLRQYIVFYEAIIVKFHVIYILRYSADSPKRNGFLFNYERFSRLHRLQLDRQLLPVVMPS